MNIESRKLYGKDDNLVEDAARSELSLLCELCQGFPPTDIWNADETGLNYAMHPHRVICQSAVSDNEKDERIILLVCANGDSSENFLLRIVEN